MIKKRENYIDFVRGIVILQVIQIHTSFHSGGMYLPDIFRNVSLFLDVPVFFILTGMTFASVGKLNPVKQMLKISLVFTFFLIFYQIAFSDYSIEKIVRSIFLNFTDIPKFPTVGGSYWFIPVYVSSVLLTYIIYNYFSWFRWPFVLLSFIYYLLIYTKVYTLDCIVLLSTLRYCLFYTSLIILGTELSKAPTKQLIFLIVTSIVVIIVFKYYQVNLQESKFPVNIPYIICSLPSCFIILALKRRLNSIYTPIVNYIGQNSIFFYLTQGVGASILFDALPYMTFENIYLKYILCLSINLIFSIFLGCLYCYSYKFVKENFFNFNFKRTVL